MKKVWDKRNDIYGDHGDEIVTEETTFNRGQFLQMVAEECWEEPLYEIEKMGAKVIEQYAVLGEYDFINILDAPDNETISRISIELGSRGTIQLITLAAIPIDELEDSLLEK